MHIEHHCGPRIYLSLDHLKHFVLPTRWLPRLLLLAWVHGRSPHLLVGVHGPPPHHVLVGRHRKQVRIIVRCGVRIS